DFVPRYLCLHFTLLVRNPFRAPAPTGTAPSLGPPRLPPGASHLRVNAGTTPRRPVAYAPTSQLAGTVRPALITALRATSCFAALLFRRRLLRLRLRL